MLTDSYNYFLPDGLIASEPVVPRDLSRLMVLDRVKQEISHEVFYHFDEFLNEGDVLVLNETKVIPCRIKFGKNEDKRGGEIFITEFLENDLCVAMIRPGKIFREGAKVFLFDDVLVRVEDIREDGQRVLKILKGGSVDDLLKRYGEAPFPPYIGDTKASFEQYQTVFAENEGSLAAPTAGLHFTKKVFNRLENKGVKIVFVTLNVGLGTFLPVKSKHFEDHLMHSESYFVSKRSADVINGAHLSGKRVVAVGTTSVRVLESSFVDGGVQYGGGDTDIFIYPGYKWRVVDGLMTNFHLPKSTLLMLLSSFAGKDFVFRAYEEAILKKYRFYSFGDGMLVL